MKTFINGLLFLSLFLLPALTAPAQNTPHVIEIDDENDNGFGSFATDSHHNLYLSGWYRLSSHQFRQSFPYIIKLTPSNDTLRKIIDIGEKSSVVASNTFAEGGLVLAGVIRMYNPMYSSDSAFFIMRVDTNLAVEWIKIHPIGDSVLNIVPNKLCYDSVSGRILLSGKYTTMSNNRITSHPYLAWIGMDGELIKENYLSQYDGLSFEHPLQRASDSSFCTFSWKFYTSNTICQKITIDTALNITEIKTANHYNYMDFYMMGYYLNRETVLLPGKRKFSSATWDFSIAELDVETMEVKDWLVIPKAKKNDYAAWIKSLDRLPNGNFVYGGTHGMGWKPDEKPDTSHLYIATIATNPLRVLSEYYYGGDAHYNMYYIGTMPDGTVTVVATKDHNLWGDPRDVVILRFPKEMLDGTNKKTPAGFTQLLCYPNPGANKVTARCGIPLGELRVHNMAGQLLLRQTSHIGENELDTSSLPAGMYVISLHEGSRLVSSQKWSKLS